MRKKNVNKSLTKTWLQFTMKVLKRRRNNYEKQPCFGN